MKKEKNKKELRKSEIYQLIGKTVCAIVAVLVDGYVLDLRIQNLGGLYLNFGTIMWLIISFCLVFFSLYGICFWTGISSLKIQEADKEYFKQLKDALNGNEKEVFRKYGIGEDAQILKSVAETHKLRYFVRTNEDSIFIFTRDCNDKESPHKQIPIEFFHKYFEFKTE